MSIAAVISGALWEYYNIAKAKHSQPLVKIGIIGTVIYVFAVYIHSQMYYLNMLPEMVLALTLAAAFIYYFIKGSDPFVNLAVTAFGLLYLTIPLSCLISINYFDSATVHDGRWALIYLLFVSKMTDTAAFFVGKRIGQTKLTPYISPKKTWEGAIGGLVGALLTSIIFYFILQLFATPPFELTFFQSLWLAVFISIAAQFGDLAESLLKRDVGVKDSSGLPGLGGMLDIVDSLIFTAPLMYFFLKITAI
jgi:phosphatidate cytidylyltransferase